MTPRNPNTPTTSGLLEDILEKLESIDVNVEQILDQLTDHLFDTRYGAWPHELGVDDDAFD